MSDKIHRNVWNRARQAVMRNMTLVLFKSGKSFGHPGLENCVVYTFEEHAYCSGGLLAFEHEAVYRTDIVRETWLIQTRRLELWQGKARTYIFAEVGCELEGFPTK